MSAVLTVLNIGLYYQVLTLCQHSFRDLTLFQRLDIISEPDLGERLPGLLCLPYILKDRIQFNLVFQAKWPSG
ncbi:hypothetical protein GGR54DRAFT_624392 [Hypoxylon sp. NC1633]|nr:hypothetical protein GGR54DRAFT_624392 [Hypoxylon sp. NC1633]